ncbi:hypothetical protein CVS30_14465 [Arthrobacter psychrolactophilus]|uniref:Alternate-type signal peptide domain-containing protein n=1 Tax=Arthrobacter psychrolactophilus TaxID=92442 RepID=A0A2V5INC0_9MICC|nr:alternate-type signal peptide domain-containing protein [Arthrobacter psychrolactophilus]PYI37601.1 hypothetical protein CVS30_14465 [Arthrobacter psychrolactophilus]
MKKVMKAAIAAGAASALLLGGAGTYALWNGTDDINAGTVTTGHLTLDATAAGVWSDASTDAANTTFNPATDRLVPGDTVTFEQTVSISAEGKNLKGALEVGTLNAVPVALAGQVSVDLAADATAAGLSKVGNVISFAAPGNYDIPVTITVTFDAGTAGSTPVGTMDQALDLGALTLNLNQVR